MTWTKERSGSYRLYLLAGIDRKAGNVVDFGDKWRKRLNCKGLQDRQVIVNVQGTVVERIEN